MTMTPTRRTFLGQMAAALAAPGTLLAQVRMPTRAIPTTGEMLPIVGLGSSAVVLEIPENGPAPVAAVIRMLMAQGGRVVDTVIGADKARLEESVRKVVA